MSKKLIVISLLLLILTSNFAQQPAANKNYIGINLRWSFNDWVEDRMFADVMKSARQWYKPGHWGDEAYRATMDANFWPTEDAIICVADIKNSQGTYKVSFTGQATIISLGFDSSIGTIANKIYNSSSNTTTCDMVLVKSSALTMQFTGTTGGIKNLKIMRPLTPGSTQSYPTTTLFSDQIKNLVSKFQVIRFMDFFATNSNGLTTWSERSLPSDASFQQRKVYSFTQAGVDYKTDVGGCYEYAIMLCNETGKDFWLNIPLKADDAFITKLAQLIKYGSDGVNPYTSTQANPLYPPLNSNIKVYVEYSNEVWNTAYGFRQSDQNHDLAIAEVNAGNSPLNYDGSTNDWFWAWRRVGKRIVECSNIFRSVFGDAAMMTQIRPILMGQQTYITVESESLMLIDQVYGKISQWCTNPHPVNYYLYGAGGAGYYGPDNQSTTLTIDNMWTSATMDINNWITTCKEETARVKAFGLKRICYEGGPSLENSPLSNAVKEQSFNDVRTTTNLVDHFDNAWSATDGDLFMYYASTMGYELGFTNNIFDLNTRKLNAIDQLNNQTKALPTVCGTPPLTIYGKDHNGLMSVGTWGWVAGNAQHLKQNYYAIYMFRITQAGNYDVKIQLNVNTGPLTINCDGKDIGVQTSSGTLPVYTLSNLEPGLHTIMFKTSTGEAEIQTITINPGLGQITSLENIDALSESSSISIYPNPANDKIYLQTNEISAITIYSANGQLVKVQNSNCNDGIDISKLARGIYFMEVQTISGKHHSKFIKE